jgi:HlyD family secretion protein
MAERIKSWIISLSILIGLIIFIVYGSIYIFRVEKNHHYLTLYGNVDVREVDIGFRVPGLVTSLRFEEGDVVHQGALMATLDATPYDDKVREAAAALESIKASYKNSEILLKRRKELIGVGGVSQEDLDNAQASRDQLAADLLAAQAALAVARDNLDYTYAYCPTDGIVLSRVREPGTVVNASDPVYTFSVASPVWVRAYVNEPNLGRIFFGQEAEVTTDTAGGPTYTGKIGFISPVSEFTPKTVQTTDLRTDLVYRLRIYIDHPDQLLKQGMPVTVEINLKKNKRRE